MAADRGLADGEVLVSIDMWHRLRDAIYVAETTAADAGVDVVDANTRKEWSEIVSGLREAIAGVVEAVGEPIAVADPE